MTVSEQVKVLYVRCNVSEAELARRLGRTPQSLNAKLKRGTMTVGELEKIAAILGVEFKRFLFLEMEMKFNEPHKRV
jgi:transcriptional regulator with XRE-family HTH domain